MLVVDIDQTNTNCFFLPSSLKKKVALCSAYEAGSVNGSLCADICGGGGGGGGGFSILSCLGMHFAKDVVLVAEMGGKEVRS